MSHSRRSNTHVSHRSVKRHAAQTLATVGAEGKTRLPRQR